MTPKHKIFYLLTFLDGVWFFILALFVSLVSTSVLCLSWKIAFFAVFIFLFCFDRKCFIGTLFICSHRKCSELSFVLVNFLNEKPPPVYYENKNSPPPPG